MKLDEVLVNAIMGAADAVNEGDAIALASHVCIAAACIRIAAPNKWDDYLPRAEAELRAMMERGAIERGNL